MFRIETKGAVSFVLTPILMVFNLSCMLTIMI